MQKIAIVGLGQIANVHASVLKEFGYNVVALCDGEIKKAELFKNRYFKDAELFTDYEKMLTVIKPTVVHICTPHFLHANMIISALSKNINVLCEKPLCIDKRELEDILKAEENSKAVLGVCLQNRYGYCNSFVKEYLKDKKVFFGFGYMVWHRDLDYYNSGEWRGKKLTEGGGVMINQALHTLDLLQWLVGMPEYCNATTTNLILKEIEVEDSAVGTFFGNANFNIFATNSGAMDLPVEITLHLGKDVLNVSYKRVALNGQNIVTFNENEILGKGCYGVGHKGLIRDYYDCLETGKKFSIDGKEASKVMKLIFAMYESNNRTIKI